VLTKVVVLFAHSTIEDYPFTGKKMTEYKTVRVCMFYVEARCY
jgi:hypothetical protein